MTIDPFPCLERNVHVRPDKTFYPVKIPVDHNQLRQLLSCPSDNQLYYVQNEHVYCLDTSTRKRTHIVELPFNASCTAAGYGWFCAGGHGPDGHFAAVKLPDPPTRPNYSVPDGPLISQSTHERNSLPYRMRHERLGKCITNSVSIQRLRGSRLGSDDEVVAILTNNDHTVRIYSLTRSVELTVEKFDFPMNHASISPDGRLMLLVGDRDEGHLYERRTDRRGNLDESVPDWIFLRKIPLYKPPTAKLSCYFTTAWSSTGRLCATASEHGFLTVFDTESLKDPELDPIVAIVPSSRPNTTPGAIRAMCFAPAPWDLLMWTENRGRMCVADLRSGLGNRQVIHLDPAGDNITQIETKEIASALEDPGMHDFGAEIEFIRRHQRALGEPNNAAAVSFASDYLAHSAERRRLQQEAGVPELDDDLHGLTEEEQQILDGLRTTRQQQINNGLRTMSAAREASLGSDAVGASERNDLPRSVTYTPSARRRIQSDYSQASAEESAEARHESAVLGSIRDYMRLSRFDDSVPSPVRSSGHQPRRQTAVVISTSQAAANAATPPAQRPSAPPGDPWHTIEAAMRNATSSSSTAQSSSTNQPAASSDGDSIPDLLPLPSSTSTTSTSSAVPGGRAGTLHTFRDRGIFIDAERRRINELTANGQRTEALTTRGEAMYARLQRERERAVDRNGEREREREREREINRRRSTGLQSYEANFFRQMHPGLRHTAASLRERTARDTAPPDGIDDSNYPLETWGVGTSGICWGDGGRVVYVGTENGIFELKMDFEDRKYWAAISLR